MYTTAFIKWLHYYGPFWVHKIIKLLSSFVHPGYKTLGTGSASGAPQLLSVAAQIKISRISMDTVRVVTNRIQHIESVI
jgi:hypothetical protein